MEQHQYMVYVQCSTYNQSKYIRDALDGFCMQQTNFPFVCGVIDDASTDGEQEVLVQYLQEHFCIDKGEDYHREEFDDCIRVFARHKTNANCFFLVVFLKTNHYQNHKDRSKYVKKWKENADYYAACEGDDYWIDTHKLQKQVDFLEKHPDYTICATNAIVLWAKGERSPSYFRNYYENGQLFMSQLIGNWACATATLMYRKTVLENYPEWTKQLYFGDMTLMLIATHYGKFQVLSDVTSVYRKTMKNKGSVTRALADKMDYVNQQQVKLYEAFNEWTEGKYSDAVLKEIKRRKKEVKFYQYRRKGRLVPYIMMPAYMISKRLKKN